MKKAVSALLNNLEKPVALRNIWLLAIVLRVGYIVLVTPPPTADFLDYHELATRLADGQGYIWENGTSTAYRAIGYPAFLAGVYSITGPSIQAGQLANTILCLLALWLAYQLARNVLKHELAARLALLALAVHPNGIAYCGLLASEPLSLCALLGAVLVWKKAQTAQKAIPWIILCGVLFAIATYTKPQIILIPGMLFLMPLAWQGRPSRPWLQTAGIYVVVFACIAPWTYRNYQQLGEAAFISTNGGANLYVGNSRFASGRFYWGQDVEDYLAVHAPEDEMPVPAWSKRLGELAIQDMKAFPLKTALRFPKKVFFLYAADIDGLRWSLLSYEKPVTILSVFYYALMVLGQLWYVLVWLPFVYVIWKKSWRKLPASWGILLLPALSFTFISLIFFGASRFHFPFLPFLVVLSAGIFDSFLRSKHSLGRG
ncbi:MAG: glycosyltransferase family 39 protein [Bacteroidia bacterium]